MRMFEEPLEPAHPLTRVVEGPELLHRVCNLQPEGDRRAADSPGEGAADVVLLGDCDVEPLSARRELPDVEVRALGDAEEVLGIPSMNVLRLRRLHEPFACVLPNRVEHPEAAGAPTADEALDDE